MKGKITIGVLLSILTLFIVQSGFAFDGKGNTLKAQKPSEVSPHPNPTTIEQKSPAALMSQDTKAPLKMKESPSNEPVIESVSELKPGLEAGGREVELMLKGKNLDKLTSGQVLKMNNLPAKDIEVKLGPPSATSRKVMLKASDKAQTGSNYKLKFSAGAKAIDVPLTIANISVEKLKDTGKLKTATHLKEVNKLQGKKDKKDLQAPSTLKDSLLKNKDKMQKSGIGDAAKAVEIDKLKGRDDLKSTVDTKEIKKIKEQDTQNINNVDTAKTNKTALTNDKPKSLKEYKAFVASLPVDNHLKERIEANKAETYRVYMSNKKVNGGEVWRKSWNGQLLLPDPLKTGKVEAISYKNSKGEAITDKSGKSLKNWVIRNDDGSVSKVLLDRAGRTTGLLTSAPNGSVMISIDIDGDQVIDAMNIISPNGLGELVVADGKIRQFDDWLERIEPWCLDLEDGDPAVGESDVSGAALKPCGKRSGRGGGDGGISQHGGGGRRPGNDAAFDQQCKDILAKGRPGGGSYDVASVDIWESIGDAISDLNKDLIILEIDAYEWVERQPCRICNWLTGSEPDPPSPPSTSLRNLSDLIESQTDQTTSRPNTPNDQNSTSDPHPATPNSEAETQPTEVIVIPDSDGMHFTPGSQPDSQPGSQPVTPGEDPRTAEQVMYDLCLKRAQNKTGHYSVGDLDQRYVKEKCPDPASDPNPSGSAAAQAQSAELSTWCSNSEEDRDNSSTIGGLFRGSGGGNGCGILEQPGPDGKCSGKGKVIRGPRGTVGVALGTVFNVPNALCGNDPACTERPGYLDNIDRNRMK